MAAATPSEGGDREPKTLPGLTEQVEGLRHPSLRQQEIRERRVRLESAPATINIELTGRCNYKPACAFCVGKNADSYQEPGHMSREQLSAYWPHLVRSQRVNDCSYGEPLLYPGFDEVVDRLAAAGVRFGFTTNGLLLNGRRAALLVRYADTVEFVVSLNAATPETYWSLHGQDFARVIGNVERFITLHRATRPGQRLPLFLSFIVMRCNRHEALDFLRLAMKLGVEHVMLRHLFDIRVGPYRSENFGHHFVYEEERLPLADYVSLEREVRRASEFAGLGISYTWDANDSFIAEQAEPGVDIRCLFPWKFLCVRPLHDSYTPCTYLKRSIAAPSATTIEEVWNGETIVAMRASLAAGELPDLCMTFGDACPLVLERKAREVAAPPPPAEEPPPATPAKTPSAGRPKGIRAWLRWSATRHTPSR
jgi:MoaA/NifB/PqqE/SkfB family radical SAM enzyme